MYIKLIDSLVKGALGLLYFKLQNYPSSRCPITAKLHHTGIYGTIPGLITRSSFLTTGDFV